MTAATGTIEVAAIPPLGHDEAMRLAAAEYERFLDVVRHLRPEDWAKPTDCTEWDVRAMVGHNLGNFEAAASVRELAGQQLKAARRAKREGTTPLDAMSAVQVDERAALSTTELLARLERVVPKAVAGRRRAPAVLRTRVKLDLSEGRKRPLGYLLDAVFTRDSWMHRVDLARATGTEMVLTPDHDGRIVANVVADWADNHGRPFHLVLTGPAGGAFVHGAPGEGESHELDAVEFCRTLAGRAPGAGLLSTGVLF
jgi:uncharacterized protein (TIGR03083 family)